MAEEKLFTFSVLVSNQPGVLSQISRLFARTGFNIESITAGRTTRDDVTRITVEVLAEEQKKDLLANLLMKMMPVISVKVLPPEQSIRRELALIKVKADSASARSDIMQVVNVFRGSIIDVSKETLTVSVIGDEKKAEAMLELLEDYGVIEVARSGIIALERGKYTIDEATKEKGEFDYGKNFL